MSKPAARVYPEILTDVEKFPSELSCAERSVSAPQSIAANLFASTAIASMLYYLLIGRGVENKPDDIFIKKIVDEICCIERNG